LDVVGQHPEKYAIHALVAGHNVDLLARQIMRFRPDRVATATEETRESLRKCLADSGLARREWPELLFGPKARVDVATDQEVDFVMSAIVGVAGLEATYEAICRGKRVGLANKEVLVASGKLVMDTARKSGTELIPVDSEHNGAHQCLRAGKRSEVSRLILTASGGPFRETSREKLAAVTPAEALNHPTWKMGQRITIDSATLMNKGFEVIEACRLFNLPPSRVQVMVHPQSTIHSMVEFVDGSILAQFSVTDMRLPILYALTYPDRIPSDMHFPVMDLRHLEFLPPDMEKFPCLGLAYEAAESGGAKTVALNAADEVAVAAFLQGRIAFNHIPEIIREVLSATEVGKLESIEQVLQADSGARELAHERVERASGRFEGSQPVPSAVRVE
jgi:1-deoxy-D-xylulose-5-phosphate reductoisomerase